MDREYGLLKGSGVKDKTQLSSEYTVWEIGQAYRTHHRLFPKYSTKDKAGLLTLVAHR